MKENGSEREIIYACVFARVYEKGRGRGREKEREHECENGRMKERMKGWERKKEKESYEYVYRLFRD